MPQPFEKQCCIPSRIRSKCCFQIARDVRERSLTIQPDFVVLLQEFSRASQFRFCLSGHIPEILLTFREMPVLETLED